MELDGILEGYRTEVLELCSIDTDVEADLAFDNDNVDVDVA